MDAETMAGFRARRRNNQTGWATPLNRSSNAHQGWPVPAAHIALPALLPSTTTASASTTDAADNAEPQSVPCTTCGWPSLSYECFTECRDNQGRTKQPSGKSYQLVLNPISARRGA